MFGIISRVRKIFSRKPNQDVSKTNKIYAFAKSSISKLMNYCAPEFCVETMLPIGLCLLFLGWCIFRVYQSRQNARANKREQIHKNAKRRLKCHLAAIEYMSKRIERLKFKLEPVAVKAPKPQPEPEPSVSLNVTYRLKSSTVENLRQDSMPKYTDRRFSLQCNKDTDSKLKKPNAENQTLIPKNVEPKVKQTETKGQLRDLGNTSKVTNNPRRSSAAGLLKQTFEAKQVDRRGSLDSSRKPCAEVRPNVYKAPQYNPLTAGGRTSRIPLPTNPKSNMNTKNYQNI